LFTGFYDVVILQPIQGLPLPSAFAPPRGTREINLALNLVLNLALNLVLNLVLNLALNLV
jgi:hypothetical protein